MCISSFQMSREELCALPNLRAKLVEEGAEDVLLGGFEVILGENKSRKRAVGVIPNQEGGELPNPNRCFLFSFS